MKVRGVSTQQWLDRALTKTGTTDFAALPSQRRPGAPRPTRSRAPHRRLSASGRRTDRDQGARRRQWRPLQRPSQVRGYPTSTDRHPRRHEWTWTCCSNAIARRQRLVVATPEAVNGVAADRPSTEVTGTPWRRTARSAPVCSSAGVAGMPRAWRSPSFRSRDAGLDVSPLTRRRPNPHRSPHEPQTCRCQRRRRALDRDCSTN